MEQAYCELLKLEGKYRKIIANTMVNDDMNKECYEATVKLNALMELEDILCKQMV